jgi:hypothetical protein
VRVVADGVVLRLGERGIGGLAARPKWKGGVDVVEWTVGVWERRSGVLAAVVLIESGDKKGGVENIQSIDFANSDGPDKGERMGKDGELPGGYAS